MREVGGGTPELIVVEVSSTYDVSVPSDVVNEVCSNWVDSSQVASSFWKRDLRHKQELRHWGPARSSQALLAKLLLSQHSPQGAQCGVTPGRYYVNANLNPKILAKPLGVSL